MGTPLYMSPEQMRGGQPVTAAIDVWALGVVLYQLLSESVLKLVVTRGVDVANLTHLGRGPSIYRRRWGIAIAFVLSGC